MPPNQGQSYDFIMNPAKPKRSLLPRPGGGSFVNKLLFIVGGAFGLIIIMWIVGTILGGSTVDEQDIVGLTQTQQEVARVAGEGEDATDQATKNTAKTIQLTLITQQKEWLAFLQQQADTEVDPEDLALKKNAATDTALQNAHANNTFDKTLLDGLRTFLTQYASELQTVFGETTNPAQQALLTKHYQQTVLLLEQLP